MPEQVHHRLVGYDRTSRRVAIEFEIPDTALSYIKTIVAIDADDPDAVFCYHPTPHQARDIAGDIGAGIDADAHNFYIEGYSEPMKHRA